VICNPATELCQPFTLQVTLHRLSIRKILQQELFAALPTNFSENLLPAQIPLYRLKHPTAIIYRSRLPLAIANSWLERLAAASCHGSGIPLLAFTVKVRESDCLDFHLQEPSLALWLQQLPQQLRAYQQSARQEMEEIKANFFPLQYVHARCCSLLRLGHRERLLEREDFPRCQWQLGQPAERQVIRELLAVCDALDSFSPSLAPNWQQLGAALARAFCQFERKCRIFGEIKQENPALSQARLGLIAVTQLVLRVLLEHRLGIAAPTEL
jgi:hypothetical protein